MDSMQASSDGDTKATLLFVDDEQNILTSLRRLFKPLGYNILIATGGAAGLEILKQQPVDVVVSDMRMPEMDGAAFLEQVAVHWPDTIRILLTGFSDVTATIAAINKGSIYKYISKPWEDTDLKTSIAHALEKKFLTAERQRLLELTRIQNEELKELNTGLEEKVKARTEDLRRAMGMLETAHESLKKSYTATVKVFSNIIEMREKSVAGHARRVAGHARNIAIRMGMTTEQAQDVLFAALLHDIGKMGLPDELLTKPLNTLTNEERAKIFKHPVLGEGLLMALEPLQNSATLIRHHHELYDGTGFPAGLSGTAIPLGARILSVVNDYDAIQIGTLFKQRVSAAEAIEFLRKNRGKRYDPAVVDAFLLELGAGEKPKAKANARAVMAIDLKVGMVLARDLITDDGVMLLSNGYILDEKLIERIQRFESSMVERLKIFIVV